MPDWLAPVPALRERIHPSTSTRQVRTLRKGMKLMAAKNMAEVLAEHRISPDFECECGTDFYPQSDDPDAPDAAPDAFGTAFEAHQAAALSAAGFGLVADAKAEAWDHGHHDGAVDAMLHMENDGAKTTPNPYRAAS